MRGLQPRGWMALFLLAGVAFGAAAQSPAPPAETPRFDFASIRQNVNPEIRWRMEFTPNGVNGVDVTLAYVLEEAYGLYDGERWSGVPQWARERRFNIEARFDPARYRNITLEQRRAMLQQLLADRFGLVVHHELREGPVYALVVASHGPKLEPSRAADLRPATVYGSSCVNLPTRGDRVAMKDCTTGDLVSTLNLMAASDLNRRIVDRTGLTGHYNFDLAWSPEDPVAAARLDSDAPTLFTALRRELGLELKAAKGPLDTIVVDRVTMPSPN